MEWPLQEILCWKTSFVRRFGAFAVSTFHIGNQVLREKSRVILFELSRVTLFLATHFSESDSVEYVRGDSHCIEKSKNAGQQSKLMEEYKEVIMDLPTLVETNHDSHLLA